MFNLHAEHIMRNAGLEETQAGIKIAGRNIINLRYADDTTIMAESKEKLTIFLTRNQLLIKNTNKWNNLPLFNAPLKDWKKHKLESRLPGEISITSDMQMTPPLWQKVKRN